MAAGVGPGPLRARGCGRRTPARARPRPTAAARRDGAARPPYDREAAHGPTHTAPERG
ncbi:hypothetical protein NKH77_49165 [Streptomyces sp. M19]